MKNHRRVPITDRHRALLSSPSMGSQLPIKFACGNQLTEWAGFCLGCEKRFSSEQMHGVVSQPLESVVSIESVAVCQECNLLTPFCMRVRDDLSREWVDEEGRWVRSSNHGTRYMEAGTPEPARIGNLLKALALWLVVFVMMFFPMILGVLSSAGKAVPNRGDGQIFYKRF
jgi:hypothetical protein